MCNYWFLTSNIIYPQSSGIKISDEITDSIKEVKKDHKFKTLYLKLNDKNDGIVEQEKHEDQTFDEMVEEVKANYLKQPLYIIHDFKQDHVEGLCYISW